MSKSFLYFIWTILFLLLVFYIGSVSIIAPFFKSAWGGDPSLTDQLGRIIGLILLIPLYKLYKLRQKIKEEIDGKKILSSMLLLSIWLVVPLAYHTTYSQIRCLERYIDYGRGPARCYTQTPRIFELSPSSGPNGTRITIKGEGFVPAKNLIMFGDPGPYQRSSALDNAPDNVVGYYESNGGASITLPVPLTPSGRWCDASNNCDILLPADPRAPGVYNVSISNKNGTSNTVPFTITP